MASPDRRFTDQAIQLVECKRGDDGKAAPTGRESEIYGGVWDVLGRRYDETQIPRDVVRYRVSEKQFEILQAAATGKWKHFLVKGGRRSSKSELFAIWVALRGVLLPGVPISLAFKKLKKAVRWSRQKLWPRISSLVVPGLAGRRKSLLDFGFMLRNGTDISFITAEVVDDPRGEGSGSVGCDERQIVGKELMDNLMLSLSEHADYQTLENGTALQGEFQDYYEDVLQDPNYYVAEMTTFDNCFIDLGFVEDAKKHMDPRRFAQEVMGEFAPQSAVVYHQYERGTHLKRYADAKTVLADRYGISRNLGKDITADVCGQWFGREVDFMVGMDFNVAPLCSIIFKVLQGPPGVGDVWWATDEVILPERADATRAALEIKRRGFFPAAVVPDASGAYSEGGRSSHRMLRDEGYVVMAPRKNPDVVDRINAVNSLLNNARGHVRLFVDPRCTSLVKCLENHKNDKSGKPEKDKIHEHRGDALGYPIAMMVPATIDFDADRKLARERMAAIG